MAQHRDVVNQGVDAIYTADIRRITRTLDGESLQETTRQELADERTVDEAFRSASRALGAAVANGYAKRLAMEGSGKDDFDTVAAKAKVAALLLVPGVMEAVESEAERISGTWLNELRREIKSLSEERRTVYDDIKRQARAPQQVDIVTPKSRIENTKDAEGNLLPTKKLHLLADENGDFPVGALNDWELAVVDAELGRSDIVAWYRNPSNPAADVLQVPYRLGDNWKSMQPDFIFFSRKRDGSLAASIVDPHGDHLSDALPKLQGLAKFAEEYGNHFLRIEAVSEVDKDLRMLDLTNAGVRNAVREVTSVGDLYRSDIAERYE
jgi:hypothetical protein